MTQHYVAGFLFSEDRNKIALVKKEKPEWQRGRFNGIGGKIEAGESPRDAIIREFKEETGVEIEEWDEFCVIKGASWQVFFYRAFSDKINDVTTMETEEINVFHIELDCVYEMNLISNLKWLIPMALDTENVHCAFVQDKK